MAPPYSFEVTFDQLEPSDDLSAARGDLISERVMFGNFQLDVAGVDFGLEEVELLGFAIGLYRSVSHVAALGGDAFYHFADCDLQLEVTAAKNDQLIVAYLTNAGRYKKTNIDALVMLKMASKFLIEILTDAFIRYPALLRNHAFLQYCPLAMVCAREQFSSELNFSDLVYYSKRDAISLGDMTGVEITRSPSSTRSIGKPKPDG